VVDQPVVRIDSVIASNGGKPIGGKSMDEVGVALRDAGQSQNGYGSGRERFGRSCARNTATIGFQILGWGCRGCIHRLNGGWARRQSYDPFP